MTGGGDAGKVGAVTDFTRTHLPPVAGWTEPAGYPDALALCVIDAIQSIGVRYGTSVR